MPTCLDPIPTESPTIAFYTLGCKANQLETSTLADQFRDAGWEVRPFDEPAQVVVVNTCTVTERSDVESQRIVRRAHLSNPTAKIVMTGCYAQVSPEEVAALPGVTHVVGNQFKPDILKLLLSETANPEAASGPPSPMVLVGDIDKSRMMEGASTAGLDRTRGSLKIQDGCDYKCTYCIIWEARGASRCLPVADIEAHLARMVAEGFYDITLTGINIGQYQDGEIDLAGLLMALVACPGHFRLRLTSLDPLEVTDRLLTTMATYPEKICPHLHLSAQSADDGVLKRMARRHHVADMVRIVHQAKALMPDITIGSDIIVGFPGEDEQAFERTATVLSDIPMDYLHVFSYSKRKGTPAAQFEDQVPEREKKRRAAVLRTLSERRYHAYLATWVGRSLDVVMESCGRKGMAGPYIRAQLPDGALAFTPNQVVPLQVATVGLDFVVAHAAV